MADISLIQDDPLDDADEGVFEQGDGGQTDFKTLCPLLRIEKYGFSENAYDRQMVPRILLELFRSSPIDLLSTQLPSIMRCVTEMFKYSDAMIKAEFLEQIPIIAATAIECSNRLPALETLLSEYLLPMVVRNIGVNVNQIRKAAHTTLFLLIEKGFITQQQAEIQICPTVLALTNTDTPRDYDNCVVTLMSRLAHFLGRDVTERVFLQRFLQLCSSSMFYIRKMCAASFGDFCAVVGTEAYEYNLLPCYIALCEDDIWGVRKSCAEVVLSVSCACPSSKRRTTLAPIFSKLLKDESRWVRMSAFQALGPFISTFADPTVASLGYSNLGELVLVNSNGNEFKITPTDEDTNMDLHMLMIEEAKKNLLNEFEDQDTNIGKDKEDFFKISSCDEENVCANLNSENCIISKIKVEDVSLEDSIADIPGDSKENGMCGPSFELDVNHKVDATNDFHLDIMKEVINLSNCCDNLNKLHCLDVDDSDTSEDLLKHQNNNLSNHNLNKSVDSIADNCINDVDNESKCTNSFNDKNNEDLEQFNSYNYWYVSLNNIPLDPNLINDDLANQKCSLEENLFTLNSGNHNRSQDHQSKLLNYTSECTSSINGISTVITQTAHHYQINEPRTEFTGDSNLPNITETSQHIVPQLLIDHFVSMTDPILASNTDNEMAYHCAYSLPAVALTLGSNNWHLLKKTVEILAANMQYKVRRTVASSLHELAIILGQDITTANLTHIFEGFLKDLDEVRIGILKHLAHFLQLINPSQRSTYLPRLAEFLQTDNDANWRFRQELAEQLLLAVPLFHPTDANKYISTLAQDLLCDKVAAVRDVSILLVTELIRHVSSDRILLSRLLFKLAEKFAHSKRWKQRQSFALLCTQLLSMQALLPESFACDVMPHLLDLSWDPVANVRLVVARTISQHIITNEYFLDANNQHLDGLESVLRRLKADKDRDVRYSANLQVCTNV